MGFTKWSFENKHTLRELYADFLTDTGVSDEDINNGKCVSYSDFQEFLYNETIHAQ